MHHSKNNWFTRALAPILGAGAIGVCPLCWTGSAAFLTYVGLGALIPLWQWLVLVFILIGLIGFLLDIRAHKNVYPVLLLLIGAGLLYVGRYVLGGPEFGGWPIWGLGALIIVIAVIYNRRLFTNRISHGQHDEA